MNPVDPHAAKRYEREARELKASRMARAVPYRSTEKENRAVAAYLAGWEQVDRNRLALVAGVHPPSEETWTLLILHVANRKGKPPSP